MSGCNGATVISVSNGGTVVVPGPTGPTGPMGMSGQPGPPSYPQTAVESAAGITPTNTSYTPGYFYRYGAKGGAGRVGDAVAAGAVLTSASGAFAGALAGMVAVVVDGGASRTGGRPAPLITTILSVQSASQITLSTSVIQPTSISLTGTVNNTVNVTSLSQNPITAGVGLARTWTITSTNFPSYAGVASITSNSLVASVASTGGSGTASMVLSAPFEVCFGSDDSAAIIKALLLPYPIVDVADNFLTTQALSVGSACANLNIPSAMLIFALGNNTSHCVTAAGFDRGNSYYVAGVRYRPFNVVIGEIECCNTGLDGVELQQSTYSNLRARVNNPFRNGLGEFFLVDYQWQESNTVDINIGRAGLHFHHKVNKAAVYQNLGSYRICGRASGLNSVYLGINASTQKDQLGGAIRIYAGSDSLADSGISQNSWGMAAPCELDGERSAALSYGSDICNSPVTFVDATQTYVIEGAPGAGTPSNYYYTNLFGAVVTEDITQTSDTRGGYIYYAMANTQVYQTTILSMGTGPWGQSYINAHWANGVGNLTNFGGGPGLTYAGNIEVAQVNAATYTPTLISSTALAPAINTEDNNAVLISTSFTTIMSGDYNCMFFVQDATGGGGAIGFMTTDTTTITLVGTTVSGVTFQRAAMVGLQAKCSSGTRNLRVMSLATGT